MLASRKSRESREMARRSFYSTRRQCRRCQGVVVGDAEDVPSSMIAVEVEGGLWAGRGTSSSRFSTSVRSQTQQQPPTFVPRTWSWSLVPGPGASRDRDERVTWRVAKPTLSISLRRIQMPPRRSTRSSSRLSVEPENQPPPQRSAPPSKRKRSSGDNLANDEVENEVKPPSRTTRRSSSSKPPPPATSSRASSRSKSALRQVQDSDDDDDDQEPSHPAKKSRPSPELEDVHEEDEEDVKPIVRPRTRGAAITSAASSANGRSSKGKITSDSDGEDATEERVPAKPSSRPSSCHPQTSACELQKLRWESRNRAFS
jgi:hypothetical protein